MFINLCYTYYNLFVLGICIDLPLIIIYNSDKSQREAACMEEQKLYTIGETAKLFDVGVQTLRFYEKLELFSPAYVNPETGYRYYSQGQFHYIDRIKYLQSLGLTLVEIREILQSGQSGQVDELLFFLRKKQAEQEAELTALQEKISDIKWYIEYFQYLDSSVPEGKVYTSMQEERYLLSAPCSPTESFAEVEMRLTTLRSKEQFKGLPLRRQYGFLMEYDDIMKQHFVPASAAIYLKQKPDFVSPYIVTLPAGRYLCFRARLLLDEWDPAEVRAFFEENPYKPAFAIANEYEDNLTEYTATPYEIQIYLQDA